MIETSNSPLQSGGYYYTNSDNFDPQIFFTDDNNELYYIIIELDTIGDYKVIFNGKLKGYNNNYRVDLSKFINLKELDLSKYKFIPQITEYFINDFINKSNIFIVFDTVNLLTSYPSKFIIDNNGEVFLNGGTPYSLFTTQAKRNYKFYNKKSNINNKVGYSKNIYKDSYLPFTIYDFYNNDDKLKINTINENDITNIIVDIEKSEYIQMGFCYINNDAKEAQIYNNNEWKTIKVLPKPCNMSTFYYINSDGFLSMFNTIANIHPVETTEREYITIGNKQILSKSNTTKQLKINTGFDINENEMYEIIKSPYFYTLDKNDDLNIVLKRYKNNNNSFEGWKGNNLSERNIELLLEDEKIYKKISNVQIDFFD